ncbi:MULTISPECIES: hypothetical protein [unclassified Streptomyces]|uniref:hypothetical protein n=1 Tax=unclassified Streptomyces TaxID=2593676 RepID=UPI00343069D7
MTADAEVNASPAPASDGLVMGKDGMAALVDVLVSRGFTVVGPTVRDGAIVLAELRSADALPYGWGVELEAGRYRLRERSDGAAFAHAAGPQSWKPFLHPPRVREWSADRAEGQLVVTADRPALPRYAFLGVRPCDLRAIAVQDRVLTGGAYRDPGYERRRSGALLIVVECTEPGATCFCVSMGTGPAAGPGYDLVMTEVVDADGHRFWVRSGSPEGAAILAELPARPADPETRETARAGVEAAADRMGRTMPETDLRELMATTLDAPRPDRRRQPVPAGAPVSRVDLSHALCAGLGVGTAVCLVAASSAGPRCRSPIPITAEPAFDRHHDRSGSRPVPAGTVTSAWASPERVSRRSCGRGPARRPHRARGTWLPAGAVG